MICRGGDGGAAAGARCLMQMWCVQGLPAHEAYAGTQGDAYQVIFMEGGEGLQGGCRSSAAVQLVPVLGSWRGEHSAQALASRLQPPHAPVFFPLECHNKDSGQTRELCREAGGQRREPQALTPAAAPRHRSSPVCRRCRCLAARRCGPRRQRRPEWRASACGNGGRGWRESGLRGHSRARAALAPHSELAARPGGAHPPAWHWWPAASR